MGSTLEAQKKKAPPPKKQKVPRNKKYIEAHHEGLTSFPIERNIWSDMPENPTSPKKFFGSLGRQHLIYRVPKDGKPPIVKGPERAEWVEDPILELNDGGMARKTRVF